MVKMPTRPRARQRGGFCYNRGEPARNRTAGILDTPLVR
jgi:hypothetical protein